jgi:hypothetical protein
MDSRILLAVLVMASLSFAASDAEAAVKVTISNAQVDCGEPAKVTATLTDGASLLRADFYVDDYLFQTKNLKPGSTEISASFDTEDWAHIKAGPHNIRVELMRLDSATGLDTVIGEGELAIVVAGRRCSTSSTTLPPATTSLPPITCVSGRDCAQAVTGELYCTGSNVTQDVSWGECVNPGTTQSACISRNETIVMETCLMSQYCDGGHCINSTIITTTTSTTLEPTTSTTLEVTTSTSVPEVTTTQPIMTTTTESTTTTLFQRTNTKLDRIVEILEWIISIVFFWK